MAKGKKKRRKPKQAAQSSKLIELALDIVSGLISGVATAAVLKLLGW